jgi:hypothetical protein
MILSTHGLIASQITQFVGLLDLYPSAAAAYSLRRLRGGYIGSAIEVRRTNLDVADIGFTSTGELDTAALLAFTGTGALDNGFVTKWYDQSGNGRNATQTIALNQPQIVSSGSVITDNGKPCVDWTTSSYMVNSSFNPSSSTGFSAFNVYSSNLTAAANTTTLMLYTFGSTTVNFNKGPASANIVGEFMTFARSTSSQNGRLGSTTYRRTANTQVLESEFYLSTGFDFYQNTNSQTMNLPNNGATTTADWSPSVYGLSGGLFINAFASLVASQNCKIQEIIFYDNSQSSNRTGIETNINDFYSIY